MSTAAGFRIFPGRTLALLSLGFLALAALPASVRAQTARPLAPDHWSYDLQEALHALGVAGTSLPLFRGNSVAAQLPEFRGDGASPELARFLEGWAHALAQEGGVEGKAYYGQITAGWEDRPDLPIPGPDGFLEGIGAVELPTGGTVWGQGQLASGERGSVLQSAGLALPVGAFDLLLGRLPFVMGQGRDPFILSGHKAVDGVFLNSRAPFHFPGFLRGLGPARLHLGLSPLISTPEVSSAWWGGAGLAFSPHPRVDLGVIRTVRFAGEGLDGWSFSNVVGMLTVRSENNAFDDSQGELAMRVRWDLLGQPLTTYLSLGFEDKATVYEDPGILVGVLAPFLSSRALSTVRYEFQAIGSRARWCKGCPREFHSWYRHPAYGDYVLDGIPLGSLLGGYGASHLARVESWFSGTPVRVWGEYRRITRGARNTLVLRDEAPGSVESLGAGLEWYGGRDLLPGVVTRASGGFRSISLESENEFVFSASLSLILLK